MGTGPVRVSYLRTMGKARASSGEMSAGSAGSVEAGALVVALCPGQEIGVSHGVERMSCGLRGSLPLLQP